LLAGTPEDLLLAELDRRGPLPVKTLVADSRLPAETATSTLAELIKEGQIFTLDPSEIGSASNLAASKTLVASRAAWSSLLGQIKTTLAAYHERAPLRLGMPRGELKSRLKLETRLFNDAIQRGQQEGELVTTETTVRLPKHEVKFSPEQEKAIDQLLAEFRAAPYNTPLPKDVAAALGEDVMLALIEGGQLIRLSEDVILLAETYGAFLDWLKGYLAENETVDVATVRDIFKTSRKYALALLEYTDEQRITRRVGDERVLR
jgi:selenocysteine-specific elongation factor